MLMCVAACLTAIIVCDGPTGPVVEALDHIERAGADLTSLTADVAYRKDDALLGGGELRTGTLVYASEDGPRLAVRFEYRIDLGDMARRAETKRLVFDDGWLVESDEASRQFIKRQIVAPGDTADPMRLGGPFPLPIGQKRADVLRQFEASVLETPPDAFLSPVVGTRDVIGLHLIPRAGWNESKDWAHVNLWYDCATWLPVGVVAVETNGDTRRIRLASVERHDRVPEEAESLLSIKPPGEGWSVDVQPWKPTPIEAAP